MLTFDVIWKRIRSYEGEKYSTKRGIEFTYVIEGERLCPSRTVYWIAKNDFKKVYRKIPIEGPSAISNDVRGPSYVWAILHDKRISQGEW